MRTAEWGQSKKSGQVSDQSRTGTRLQDLHTQAVKINMPLVELSFCHDSVVNYDILLLAGMSPIGNRAPAILLVVVENETRLGETRAVFLGACPVRSF